MPNVTFCVPDVDPVPRLRLRHRVHPQLFRAFETFVWSCAVWNDGFAPLHVVRNIRAVGLPWLLLRLQETTAFEPCSNEPDPEADSAEEVVHESVVQVRV